MSVLMNHSEPRMGVDPQLIATSSWTIDFSDIKTVKVSNISLAASRQDIKEFFCFSGDIEYVEMQKESERSQLAYITFKDSKGAETAMLLTGATIVDLVVNITPAENYQLPPYARRENLERKPSGADSAVRQAEDMVSSMLAKGFVLGKDALNKAKAFDEWHHLISNASATVASLDQKIGLSEKIGIGTAVVNEKVKEVDQQFQVFEKTKSALSVAEQTASSAGSALMNNRYVSSGASWVLSALSMVAKVAEDVTSMTKDKVGRAEEEKNEIIYRERTGIVKDFVQIHLDDESAMADGGPPVISVDSVDGDKLGII